MDYHIKLHHIRQSCKIVKAPNDSQSFISSQISQNFAESDFLFITNTDSEIPSIQQQTQFFASNLEVIDIPAWDCLPYDRSSPKAFISSNRIQKLHRLSNRQEGQRFFIITSVNSILQKTVPDTEIKDLALSLKTGDKASITEIATFLTHKGYSREICANGPCEYAIRGGILDVVIPGATSISEPIGYRIDFFGAEIESIKIFDPSTQLTQEAVKSLEILPAGEVILTKKTIDNFRKHYRENFGAALDDRLYSSISEGRSHIGMEHWMPFFYDNKLGNLLEYLHKPVIFFDEKLPQQTEERSKIIQEYYQSRLDEKNIDRTAPYHPIKPELLYLNSQELQEKIKQHITIEFSKFDKADSDNQRIIDLEIKAIPDFALAGRTNKRDPLELMNEFINANRTENSKVAIACLGESVKERISRLLLDYGTSCQEVTNFSELKKTKSGKAAIFLLPIQSGFYTNDLMLISEQAVFGEKIMRRRTSNKKAAERILEEGLTIDSGELVVHRDYGIGRFEGIVMVEAGGIKIDMIKIAYGGNDTLFVPVDEINLISRYGADNPLIQLDRLGVATWKNRKEKVKKKIQIAAEELLKIAAARHLRRASPLVPDQNLYDEFKSRFEFVETEDQLKAIEEIEEDLQKNSPMDRLICGDVGFGKTEVAMRATACAVLRENNQHQVAIIAPTTLLCRQHFKNFTERFSGTGIRIAKLSRLVKTAQAKEIKEKLANGDIDIVIGTHSLLQKNIKFKNLSLAIIDEEQHFGVAQKERLKELRNEVHTLTLSATPIPRTLQMSLTGVKDLSLIATPPIDRIAIRNFILPYDPVIVNEAVMREYNRSGRVFFVVPRVRDIEEMEPRLKEILPNIKINHAHGKMSPSELDEIMTDFADGKIDMLISTTIIESGIDIPEANTMIIYKPEMFGLAQLYQLRGRVGRGKIRAYSYFMTKDSRTLSKDSERKLEVMQNLDSLGAGFTIASHDMDIRGSGNLLGDEQSGHIKETGVELYQQMLVETIDKMRHKVREEESLEDITSDFSVTIKLGISLLIPEDYMSDLPLRMSFYKKIASVKNNEEKDSLYDELNDRFGKVPHEISNLMEIAIAKNECKKLNIERAEAADNGILISFKDNKFSKPDQLMQLISTSKNQIQIQQGQKLLFINKLNSKQDNLSSLNLAVKQLKEISQ